MWASYAVRRSALRRIPRPTILAMWVFGKKTASTKRKLAKHAHWVIPPDIDGE